MSFQSCTVEQRSWGGIYNYPARGEYTRMGTSLPNEDDTGYMMNMPDLWGKLLTLTRRAEAWKEWEAKVAESRASGTMHELPHHPDWMIDDMKWMQCISARHPIPDRMATRINECLQEIEEFILEMCHDVVFNYDGMAWVFASDNDAILFKLRFCGTLKAFWWRPSWL